MYSSHQANQPSIDWCVGSSIIVLSGLGFSTARKERGLT